MNPAAYLSHPDVCEYRVFPTGEIPFSSAVTEACRRNVCGRYGTTWTCPPGVGTLKGEKNWTIILGI